MHNFHGNNTIYLDKITYIKDKLDGSQTKAYAELQYNFYFQKKNYSIILCKYTENHINFQIISNSNKMIICCLYCFVVLKNVVELRFLFL